MAIYETAYDTTGCGGVSYTTIVKDLKKARLTGGYNRVNVKLNEHDEPFVMNIIEGGNFAVDTIPFFKHPVFVNVSNDENEIQEVVTIDVREFGRYNSPQSRFIVRNGTEYTWALKRAILNELWVKGEINRLRDISPICIATYIALISECISLRFALDAGEKITIEILCGLFYHCLFTNQDLSEDDLNRCVGSIGRATRIPAQKIYDVIGDIRMIDSIESLCTTICSKVNNVALSNLNAGTLFAACCGNWFGTNSREILAVGLEHIPTWIMIVSASLESATYRRSTLTKISTRFDKDRAGINFSRALSDLLGGPSAINVPEYAVFY